MELVASLIIGISGLTVTFLVGFLVGHDCGVKEANEADAKADHKETIQ